MALVKLDLNPTRVMLRNFAAFGLAAFGLLALQCGWWGRIVLFRLPSGAAAPVALALAALAAWCLLGLVHPKLIRPLYVGLMVVSYPIGSVVSYVVLAILFYLVITPIGLVFRLIGRDAMTRRFDPAAPTYWVPRRPVTDSKRYFRQF